MEVVYFDSELSVPQQGFRDGEAWWLDPQDKFGKCQNCLKISPYTYYGLFFVDIEYACLFIPSNGMVSDYEEGVIYTEGLKDFSRFLREAKNTLDQEVLDLLCSQQIQPTPKEYRIKIDVGKLKTSFIELAEFAEGAEERGFELQLWL